MRTPETFLQLLKRGDALQFVPAKGQTTDGDSIPDSWLGHEPRTGDLTDHGTGDSIASGDSAAYRVNLEATYCVQTAAI